MFILYADNNQLTVRQRQPVTSGSVNVCPARFEFSSDWDGLTRTAVFQNGASSRSVRLDESGQCEIPWEVLASHGRQLTAGVCGTRGEDLVLPTIWANLGTILPGAKPGEEAHPPTPDLWEQALAEKGDALDYDGLNLVLKSGKKPLSSVQMIGGGEGGPIYKFGHGLKQNGLDVSVDAVGDFSGDNTLPMTAAGVLASVGNIEALLATI